MRTPLEVKLTSNIMLCHLLKQRRIIKSCQTLSNACRNNLCKISILPQRIWKNNCKHKQSLRIFGILLYAEHGTATRHTASQNNLFNLVFQNCTSLKQVSSLDFADNYIDSVKGPVSKKMQRRWPCPLGKNHPYMFRYVYIPSLAIQPVVYACGLYCRTILSLKFFTPCLRFFTKLFHGI